MKRTMTIDAETNGLWGNVFAIGAQVWKEVCEDFNKLKTIKQYEEE